MKKSTTTTATLATLTAIAATIIITGCGNDVIGPQTNDARVKSFIGRFVKTHPLVLGPGEAWVGTDYGKTDGLIFYADGTYHYIVKEADGWTVVDSGTWSEGGIYLDGAMYSYRIDGGILTLKYYTLPDLTFSRTSEIYIKNQ